MRRVWCMSGALAAALWVAPLLFLTVFRYTHRIKGAARAARKSDGLLAAVAQESLASIRIVQGLAQEEQQIERFQAQRFAVLNGLQKNSMLVAGQRIEDHHCVILDSALNPREDVAPGRHKRAELIYETCDVYASGEKQAASDGQHHRTETPRSRSAVQLARSLATARKRPGP